MRFWRRRPVKRWRGIDARKLVMAVDVGGLTAVSAPWLPAMPCVRCGLPARSRFNEYPTTRMHAIHAECLRVWCRELTAA